jgi:hypothetical protein
MVLERNSKTKTKNMVYVCSCLPHAFTYELFYRQQSRFSRSMYIAVYYLILLILVFLHEIDIHILDMKQGMGNKNGLKINKIDIDIQSSHFTLFAFDICNTCYA